jgi:hypothetical protein
MYRLFFVTTLLFIFSTCAAFAQHGPPPIDDPNEPGPPPPPAVCPTNDERTTNDIATFLESNVVAHIRAETGLEGASVSDFEPLTNSVDGYICDALNDEFHDTIENDTWNISYYKTPGQSPVQYVAVVRPRPIDPDSTQIIMGRTILYFFDQTLNLIDAFGH